MLKKLGLASAVLLGLGLAACAPLEFEEYPNGTPRPATGRLATDDQNALPVETQLILGTLLLEGTDQAVRAEQAAVLLPLWHQWHDLNRGATPTPSEKEALLDQIQAAMTDGQLQTISSMELTREDVDSYLRENGSGFAFGQNPAEDRATPGPDEIPPAGNEPPDNDDLPFPGFDQTQTLSPDEIATLQSLYSAYRGGFGGSESGLLHGLLYLLEAKAGVDQTSTPPSSALP